MTDIKPSHIISDASPPTVSADQLSHYISQILGASLSTRSDEGLSFLRNCPEITTFIGTKTEGSLYLVKSRDNGTSQFQLVQDLDASFGDFTDISSLAIIVKGKGFITTELPIGDQVFVTDLPFKAGAYAQNLDKLRYIVSFVISGYFDALTRSHSVTSVPSGDSFQPINVTKKKINELILSLQHLEQTIETPNLLLSLHPTIQSLLSEEEQKRTDSVQELLDDSTFLNSLQSTAGSWVKEVQTVVAVSYDLEEGSASEEVSFWGSKELALEAVQKQLEEPGILLTLDILKKSKRFHAGLSFLSDSGIRDALTTASRYNRLLKDMPIQDLLSSNDLEKIDQSLSSIFDHLKKLKVTQYPVDRSVLLVQNINEDAKRTIIKVLTQTKLMELPYDEFKETYLQVSNLLDTLETDIRQFTILARELLRKRSERFMVVKVENSHDLRDRLLELRKLRDEYQELYASVHKLSGSMKLEASSLLPDVESAYDELSSFDALDLSSLGKRRFSLAIRSYSEIIASVEYKIVNKLRGSLKNAEGNPNEMFSVFQDFDFLLKRPNIRNAVQDYQDELVRVLQSDLVSLERQFEWQQQSKAIIQLRNLPHFTSTIVWIKQVKEGIRSLVGKLELVLTKDWAQYPEGKKIEAQINLIGDKLDVNTFFNEWSHSALDRLRSPATNESILLIEKVSQQSKMKVCLDEQSIELASEVGNLQAMGFAVPRSVSAYADQLMFIYPYASSLSHSVTNFQSILERVDELGELKVLIQPLMKAPQSAISILLKAQWKDLIRAQDLLDSNIKDVREVKVLNTIRNLESDVIELTRKYELLETTRPELLRLLQSFNIESYTKTEIAGLIEALQKLVDNLVSTGFADVRDLVETLNFTVQNMLVDRCRRELRDLAKELTPDSHIHHSISPTSHLIVFQDLNITVSPALENSRCHWIRSLNNCVLTASSQRQLKSTSYDIKLETNDSEGTFSAVITLLNDEYNQVLAAIDYVFAVVTEYVSQWRRVQGLWELTFDETSAALGDDLLSWLKSFQDVRASRAIVDSVDTTKAFGPLVIDYTQVQSRVGNQYDSWQRKIAHRFAGIFGTAMSATNKSVTEQRKTLESIMVDFSSSVSTVLLCSTIYQLQSNEATLSAVMNTYEKGNKLLLQVGFRFPHNWLDFRQVSDNYKSLLELINDRHAMISNQQSLASVKINEAADALKISFENAKVSWKAETAQQFGDSAAVFDRFEILFSELEEQSRRVTAASKLLHIKIHSEYDLADVQTQLEDLKEVWKCLSTLNNTMNSVRSTSWSKFSPRLFRKSLDDMVLSWRALPIKVRHHSAFSDIQSRVKGMIHLVPILASFCVDAITSSHWNQIFETLTMKPVPSPLTVGDVVDLDPASHEKFLKAILRQAQSEKVIADSIKEIQDSWSTITFQVEDYYNGYLIVKGWDGLFDRLENDLNSLSTMKLSPLVGAFREKVDKLEDMLSSLHQLLTTWIDLQRNWIYLFGIFKKNADIKNLLPVESVRFDTITSELFIILNSAYRVSSVLDVINIPGIGHTFRRVSDVLSKTKKSLVGYLEKQRDLFPRFYFVGNDDLLEIVGNSSNIGIASKHISRMFPGIASLVYDSDTLIINGIVSPENEHLSLCSPISIVQLSLTSDWLAEFEESIKNTLYLLIPPSLRLFKDIWESGIQREEFMSWVRKYPNQILLVSLQVHWTSITEKSISEEGDFSLLKEKYDSFLSLLATLVLHDLSSLERLKLENIIVEVLHQQQVLKEICSLTSIALNSFSWASQQRYYFDEHGKDIFKSLIVKQGNSSFVYGFEYQGSPRKIVYTPLINDSFCAMTEALNQNFGTSLAGPAGTGKTESVKALGQNLGRMVLVFCCDEMFDFYAVSRILVGVCRIGSWGCFDEFNRLSEKMLSAMSTQIEKIEGYLGSDGSKDIDLLGKKVSVNKNAGVFITSNPSYAGRSALPDNLKSKYRTFSVFEPDTMVIAEAILISQGFVNAEYLAQKVVSVFVKLGQKCSKQPHYDFGLRALKATLLNCGWIKRFRSEAVESHSRDLESQIIVKGLSNIVLPRLVPEDEGVFAEAINVFGTSYDVLGANKRLLELVATEARRKSIQASEKWLAKCLQLYEIWRAHQGFIMVGTAGSGKSTMLECLMEALRDQTGLENLCYTIDPKVLSKEELYGSLDYATRDWTDGVLTSIIRSVIDNQKGEISKNVWVILDGDIDPLWVENLNSVLDDNKLLTLPNGERLNVPENLRLVFEVDNLKHATPATISRCGVVWFSPSLFDMGGSLSALVSRFMHVVVEREEAYDLKLVQTGLSVSDFRNTFAKYLLSILSLDLLQTVEKLSDKYVHMMSPSFQRSLETFFSLFSQKFTQFIDFLVQNVSLSHEDYTEVIGKLVVSCLLWGFAGDTCLSDRASFSKELLAFPEFAGFKGSIVDSLIYSDVSFQTADWVSFKSRVPTVSIEPQMVVKPDTVIPTLDTVRTEDLIFSALSQHRSIILSGPPGAGKTMLLMSALRRSSKFEFVGLNFSKETSPELVLKTLEYHCEYKNGSSGPVLQPSTPNKWVVVFCDEINLPSPDNYGAQPVISFIRQLIARQGFWRKRRKDWVRVSRIQFVGACNPPTDPGRNQLSDRFLRLSTVFMIDYPGEESFKQIYLTFNSALLKLLPNLRGYADALTVSMIEVYRQFCARFDRKVRAHYICSPRELTRWVRGIFQSVRDNPGLSIDGLIRIWAYEALRLFSDKLESPSDREWVFDMISNVAAKSFPYVDLSAALKRPILYSDWLSYSYQPVSELELTRFVKERLRVFSEEESSGSLVLHGDMLENILKIDRVLKNAQGHMILVGRSGSGKTTLTRFVAWMNGIKVFSLTVSKRYTLRDFDKTLRELLIRAGTKGEKICFIIDESTILEPSFLERMNTLLANAEIPGLFEGEEFSSLMEEVSQASQAAGLYLSSDEELYNWFTQRVSTNFHAVFIVSDPYLPEAPQIISSPALFNRCVLVWMGDWSRNSLLTVASEYLQSLPLEKSEYRPPEQAEGSSLLSFRDAVIDALVYIYCSVKDPKCTDSSISATPLQFILLMDYFSSVFVEKESELMQSHRHIQVGLDRLKETLLSVRELNQSLQVKKRELSTKDAEAQQTLDKMLTEQNEAERKEEASIEIRSLLESQDQKIKDRREIVFKELSEVEPLIEEAQKGVRNIKKQHLTEMRSMNNPPEAIKLTLESVCIFLGFDVASWRDVQNVVRKDDFIARIVEYDSEHQFSKEISDYMNSHYMPNPLYNYDSVNRASKACGPLLLWIQAQLRYSSILENVEPLRREMRHVEKTSVETKNKLTAIDGMVSDLRESIEVSKLQYSLLIRDTENIKIQMRDVERKVAQSTKLLENLADERSRWQSSIGEFEQQREKLIGNVILLSSFMTFGGPFNEGARQKLWSLWMEKLDSLKIDYDRFLSYRYSVVSSGELLKWEKYGLPNDDLFIENCAGLTFPYSPRYPFIVDPSGLVVQFLQRCTTPKKLVIASFLDEGYLRQLENCVRFGGSIVVVDAEYFDPAISRLVSRDTQTAGGRTLVRIGEKEIDVSPNFRLYLHTRDPSIKLLPFISSRMNVFNFTFTTTSLIKHALDITLKSEKPELDAQRLFVLKANSEFKERLKSLENDLLELLNNSNESILEDEDLTKKLELIKKESLSIKNKMAESKNLVDEIGNVTDTYQELAHLYSWFCLLVKDLWKLNRVYVFSSDCVTSILRKVLKSCKGNGIDAITLEFAKSVYSNISVSLLQEDRPLMGLLSYSLFRACKEKTPKDFELYAGGDSSDSLLLGLLNDYMRLQGKSVQNMDIEVQRFEDSVAESSIFILRSSEGFDASFKVAAFAKTLNQDVVTYSVGCNDSLEVATKLLRESGKKGQWVVIENIQMSIELSDLLPKLFDSLGKHPDFKLFLTCPVDARLTNVLCEMSKQIVFEFGPGAKLIMNDELLANDGSLTLSQKDVSPDAEKLYFALAWFYSVLKERMRFVPIGFSKKYEFNDNDLVFAKVFIDQALQNTDRLVGHVSPETIPWDLISGFIGRIMFGGKVDTSKDLQFIRYLAEKILSISTVDGETNLLLTDKTSLKEPLGGNLEDYHKWINDLPEIEPASWIGLEDNSDLVLKEKASKRALQLSKSLFDRIVIAS